MLDFSWSHIVILLTVALVVVGPKDLPRLMHMAGRWAGKARAMANDFKRSFDDMARQGELDELRREIEALRNANPMPDINNDIQSGLQADINRGVDPVTPEVEPRAGEFEVTQTPVAAAGETPQP